MLTYYKQRVTYVYVNVKILQTALTIITEHKYDGPKQTILTN